MIIIGKKDIYNIYIYINKNIIIKLNNIFSSKWNNIFNAYHWLYKNILKIIIYLLKILLLI